METDFGIPWAMQHGNGVCPMHGAMINRNGIPHCLKCAAEAAKALAQPAGIVDCEDPGDEVIKHLNLRTSTGAPSALTTTGIPITPQPMVQSDADAVTKALDILRTAPMPKDMKVFKQISKAIALLEKASAPTPQGET
jgi:hypothetical protein